MDEAENNIMSFIYGGCYLKLLQRKVFLGFLSGWDFGIFVIGNGVVI